MYSKTLKEKDEIYYFNSITASLQCVFPSFIWAVLISQQRCITMLCVDFIRELSPSRGRGSTKPTGSYQPQSRCETGASVCWACTRDRRDKAATKPQVRHPSGYPRLFILNGKGNRDWDEGDPVLDDEGRREVSGLRGVTCSGLSK